VRFCKVELNGQILNTISLSNDSSAVIVRKSYVPLLEQELGVICPLYNIEPKEHKDLFDSIEAQIDAFSRMAVDAILNNNPVEKKLCFYINTF